MTDSVVADHIYLKPLETKSIVEILEEREIDAVLPTMGGQTALNLCIEANEKGIWEKYNVKIIGVDISAIEITEDREQFRKLMHDIDIPVAPAKIATSFLEGKAIAQELGFPLVIRPSFTLGGSGASFVHNKEDFENFTDFLEDSISFVFQNRGHEVISERHQKNYSRKNINSESH